MYHADTASSIKMLISRVEWTFSQALPADIRAGKARQVHAEKRFADAATRSGPACTAARRTARRVFMPGNAGSVDSRPAGFERDGSKTQTPPRGASVVPLCRTGRSGPAGP